MTIIFAFAILYFLVIFMLFLGILRSNRRKNHKLHKFSIIIAARNEEQHLRGLLDILLNQSYPKELYQIVLANDRSIDRTYEIAREFQQKYSNLKIVQVTEENPLLVGKKGALTAAIKDSDYEILAFTDADTVPTRYWLEEVNAHFTDDTDFVTGYTYITAKNRFFGLLKNLERSAMFAVIAGSFGWNWGISTGATNQAYRRKAFDAVNGFEGIGHIRSGDDDLMLHKMHKVLGKKRFMFSERSFIDSAGMDTVKQQIHQETRRGSKWKYYPFEIKLLTLFIFVFYFLFSLAFVLLLCNQIDLNKIIILMLLKVVPEFLIVSTFLVKINKLYLLYMFPLVELIYIPYYVFFGLKGTFGRYRWKD